MPIAVFTLGIGVFCLNTTEIMVSGLLPSLSAEFDVSVSTVGYLVSVFALGMVIGGPLLTVALLRVHRRRALVGLLLVFVLGQALGAVSPEFWVLVVARVVTALAASAFFGIAVAVSAQLVAVDLRGRALSVLLGGVMIAQVVGLPVAALIDRHFGWRASFWAVAAVAAVSAVAVRLLVPVTPLPERIDVRGEVAALRAPGLWAVYATNAMVIGSIVAGTSYFSPIFVEVGGFSPGTVPWLFAVFGTGTVIGNAIIGRFVDRYLMPLIFYGLIGVTLCLVVFALVAHNRVATVAVLALLGLIGLPLNPAMGARVMRVANDGPLVSTVNASAINVGVVLGPWAGGLAISAGAGLVAPLWVGSGMAFIGLVTVAPAFVISCRRPRG
ncbi:MFS transporter [Kitasatospora sp. NPDC002040]|uniref:MFS transporter n=1 Tax=Kitasatospora sp. NPDC002040 TaxID=3154661 RepID=UPI0033182335